MNLRIKKEHLGKIVINTRKKFVLTADLSQKELVYIKNHIGETFVEDVPVKVTKKKSYSKNKINDNDK